tara:strand:- start:1541 stop:2314 length:774 start_codon:yes stop_codon:yes gene_type:complete
MKNIVFMMNIKLSSAGRYSKNRSTSYHYSIDSWKQWAEKNDAELFLLSELLLPLEQMAICWQRYYLFDILEANGIDYDQILMVDADTIVHPDAPNIFNMTEHKYTGVHNEGSYDWILRSIENYSKHIFGGKMIDWWIYINGGFQIINKKHKEFFKTIVDFYHINKDNLVQMQELFYTGTDQTPLNFLLHQNNIDFKLLPYEYNMCDMARKEILDNELTMTKIGWIYHFNCIPNNQNNQATIYWMEKTYKHFYGDLND